MFESATEPTTETAIDASPESSTIRAQGEVAQRLNHYDYFTEVEDYFLRRRGKTLLLSPVDWALIEGWKTRGVPLHVALRGIERTFDSYDSKPARARRRSIKTLLYCAEEVEAQYAEWLESQTGRAGDATQNNAPENEDRSSRKMAAQPSAQGATFAPEIVRAHLARLRSALIELRDRARSEDTRRAIDATISPAFREAVTRAVARLDELIVSWHDDACPSAELSESTLTAAEVLLDEHLPSCFTAAQLADERREAESRLASYKSRMPIEVYETTRAQLIRKRLRERAGVPRLSLFDL